MYLSDDLGLGTYVGTIGVFLCLMFLFIRVLARHLDFRDARSSASYWSRSMLTETKVAGQVERCTA